MNSRRCVICGSGPVSDAGALLSLLRPDDFFIAADGGLKLIKKLNVAPDVIVADFDSLPKAQALEDGVSVYTLPVKKKRYRHDGGGAFGIGARFFRLFAARRHRRAS